MGLKVVSILVCAASLYAADFVKSNLRSQVYFSGVPYAPLDFTVSTSSQSTLPDITDKKVVPLSLGFLINPLFTPIYKADLPFALWLGFDAGNISWAELYGRDNLGNNHEQLSWAQWNPSGTAGFSVNLVGNLDLRVMGGFGVTLTTFTHELSGHPKTYSNTDINYFAQGNLEYIVVNDLMKGTDLKVSLFTRKDFVDGKSIQAVPFNADPNILQDVNGLEFSSIQSSFPVKIGLEFSLEFGRESRKDRKSRFKLNTRDDQLRKQNAAMDTLTEWDCMAIERDYRFFISNTGDLPDVRDQFTKSQFTDVLESFLAFCEPEDLKTKEKLYASLDTNKVQLKKYQISQEDTRYKQVMSSNDINYLTMFLQYYPESKYRGNVESKIAVLKDYGAFKAARDGNSFKDYLGYLAAFPDGHYKSEAETGIFELVKAGNRQKDYEIYLKKFPEGQYVSEARRALHDLLKN